MASYYSQPQVPVVHKREQEISKPSLHVSPRNVFNIKPCKIQICSTSTSQNSDMRTKVDLHNKTRTVKQEHNISEDNKMKTDVSWLRIKTQVQPQHHIDDARSFCRTDTKHTVNSDDRARSVSDTDSIKVNIKIINEAKPEDWNQICNITDVRSIKSVTKAGYHPHQNDANWTGSTSYPKNDANWIGSTSYPKNDTNSTGSTSYHKNDANWTGSTSYPVLVCKSEPDNHSIPDAAQRSNAKQTDPSLGYGLTGKKYVPILPKAIEQNRSHSQCELTTSKRKIDKLAIFQRDARENKTIQRSKKGLTVPKQPSTSVTSIQGSEKGITVLTGLTRPSTCTPVTSVNITARPVMSNVPMNRFNQTGTVAVLKPLATVSAQPVSRPILPRSLCSESVPPSVTIFKVSWVNPSFIDTQQGSTSNLNNNSLIIQHPAADAVVQNEQCGSSEQRCSTNINVPAPNKPSETVLTQQKKVSEPQPQGPQVSWRKSLGSEGMSFYEWQRIRSEGEFDYDSDGSSDIKEFEINDTSDSQNLIPTECVAECVTAGLGFSNAEDQDDSTRSNDQKTDVLVKQEACSTAVESTKDQSYSMLTSLAEDKHDQKGFEDNTEHIKLQVHVLKKLNDEDEKDSRISLKVQGNTNKSSRKRKYHEVFTKKPSPSKPSDNHSFSGHLLASALQTSHVDFSCY